MSQKTREILIKLYYHGVGKVKHNPDGNRDEYIAQAHQAIISAIFENMPKEDYKVMLEKNSYGDGRVDGFNQALADFKKRLEEI